MIRNRFRIQVTLFTLLILVLISSSAFALVGGFTPTSEFAPGKSTVAMKYGDPSDPSYCSGTLIDQNLFVTAAHCLKYPTQRSVVFAIDATQPSAPLLPVESCAIPTEYDPNLPSEGHLDRHDLALVYFKGTLPADYQSAKVASTEMPIDGESKIIIGGYGLTVSRPDRNQPWPWGKLNFSPFTSLFTPSYAKTEIKVAETEQFFAKAGDSGGPAFYFDGSNYFLLGIDNWGDDSTFEIYTDIRAYSDWIVDSARKLVSGQIKGCGN